MPHEVDAIFGTYTGAPLQSNAALKRFCDPTNLTLDLTSLTSCQGCTKINAHLPILQGCYSGDFSLMLDAEKVPDYTFALKAQTLISLLNYIKFGLPTFSYVYAAAGKTNFISNIATWEIIDSEGSWLQLRRNSGQNDPRAMGVALIGSVNPDYTEGNPTGAQINYTIQQGCLMVGDVITFTNSAYEERNYSVKIIRIDTTGIDETNTFNVYCWGAVDHAKTRINSGEITTATVWRRSAFPEQWIETVPSYPFWGKQNTITLTAPFASATVSLVDDNNNDNAIAIPRQRIVSGVQCYPQTVWVTSYVGATGQDITKQCIDENRFEIKQTGAKTWESKLYLGNKNRLDEDVDDLTVGKTSMEVTYYYPSTDYANATPICQFMCANCRMVYEGQDAYTGYDGIKKESASATAFYCKARGSSPSGLAAFQAFCYQPESCDMFSENTPFSYKSDFFNQIANATDVKIRQLTGGSSAITNFQIETGDGCPSLKSLAGHFQLSSPFTYHHKSWFVDEKGFGFYDGDDFVYGATWRDWFSADYSLVSHLTGYSSSYFGLFPLAVSTWLTKPDTWSSQGNLDSVNDPFYQLRLYDYYMRKGVLQDSGIASSDDVIDESKVAKNYNQSNKDIIIFSNIQKNTNQNNIGNQLEFGAWDAAFKRISNLTNAEYSMRVKVHPLGSQCWGGSWDAKKESAVVDKASDTGSGIIEMQPKGTLAITCGKSAYQTDLVTNWIQGGGKVVRLEDPAKVSNRYAGQARGDQWQGAIAGDSIKFPQITALKDYKFYIKKADACAGAEQSCIPAEQGQLLNVKLNKFFNTTLDYTTYPTYPISEIRLEDGHTNYPMVFYRVAMAYCSVCAREAKFRFDEDGDQQWKCQACGSKVSEAAFVESAKPMGHWKISPQQWDNRILINEYYAWLELDDTGESYWCLHFSQDIWTRYDPLHPLFEMFINGDLITYYCYPETPDYEITKEQYDILDLIADGDYIGSNGAYVLLNCESYNSATGATVEYLIRTNETDWNQWFQSGGDKTDRLLFALYENGGKYYIRTHSDFVDNSISIWLPAQLPVTNEADYIAANVAIHSLPTDYLLYFKKADVLLIKDENDLLKNNLSALENAYFEITPAGCIYGDSDIDAYIDEKGNGSSNWSATATSGEMAFIRSNGFIYFTKSWVDANLSEAGMCLKMEMHLNDYRCQLTPRHFEELKGALANIQWIQCQIPSEVWGIGEYGDWYWNPEDIVCCPDCGLAKEVNQNWGYSYEQVHNDLQEAMILNSDPAQAVIVEYDCNGMPASNAHQIFLADEGNYETNWTPVPKSFIGAFTDPFARGWCGVGMVLNIQGFDIQEINRMPDGLEIEEAYIDVYPTNLEIKTVTWQDDVHSYTFATSGNISFTLVGVQPNNVICALGVGGLGSVTSNQWNNKINCTGLAQLLYNNRGSEYKFIGMMACPQGAGISSGSDLISFVNQGKASLIDLRNAMFSYTAVPNGTQWCGEDELTYNGTSKVALFENVIYRNLRIKIKIKKEYLDNNNLYRQTENMPSMI